VDAPSQTTREADTPPGAGAVNERDEPSVEQLRDELARAEQKIEALKDVAAVRKLRYERAEEKLDRVRQAWPRRAVRLTRQAVGLGELRSFCLFIGYKRSGHSLLGSLLDAHPDISIAHEVNVLGLVVENHLNRRELFHTLLRRSEADAARKGGRRATGYSYAVPGQWQGQIRTLRVIGAKSGEKTTLRLGRDLSELAKLERIARAPVRLVHVTRNPYDSIARMAATTKGGEPERTVAGSIDFLKRLARINDRVISSGKAQVLTVRHETFVREPRAELQRLATFLDVEPDQGWEKACARIVFHAPKRAREAVTWTNEERAEVEQIIERRAFFAGYTWTSDE
jgi:Sulfotransferase family